MHSLLDSMYIDTRRVEDDKPWHETGELITKTPKPQNPKTPYGLDSPLIDSYNIISFFE